MPVWLLRSNIAGGCRSLWRSTLPGFHCLPDPWQESWDQNQWWFQHGAFQYSYMRLLPPQCVVAQYRLSRFLQSSVLWLVRLDCLTVLGRCTRLFCWWNRSYPTNLEPISWYCCHHEGCVQCEELRCLRGHYYPDWAGPRTFCCFRENQLTRSYLHL